MTEGRIEPDGAWTLSCELFLPHFGSLALDVTFQLDPAQERTLLLPEDWGRIPALGALMDLPAEYRLPTFGGPARAWETPAFLRIEDGDLHYLYNLWLVVVTESPATVRERSRLGRDVLNQWLMVSDPAERRITVLPQTWDAQLAREG